MGPVARAACSFCGRLHPPRPSRLPRQGGPGLGGHNQADGMQTEAALHVPAQAQSLASRGLCPPCARELRSSCGPAAASEPASGRHCHPLQFLDSGSTRSHDRLTF